MSVVDRRDPAAPRYGHVRLVVRRAGLVRPLRVHAGGLAVSGGLLLVADTVAGVRGFRLSDVVRRGDELVLPQSVRLRVPWWRTGRFRFSWLSVGLVDGEPSLVAGEYRRAGARPRLVRWALDPATGLPVVGPDGWCAPVDVAPAPVRAQGVAVDGSTWWVSASAGRDVPGDLHVGRPGAFVRHRGVLPPGPEDLDWSVPGEELWCATEWPGARWVFPVDARRWA